MTNQEYNEQFWDRVRFICDEKRITIKQLATSLELKNSTLYRQITLNNCPSAYQVVCMAEVLKVSVNYLTTGSEYQGNSLLEDKIKHLESTLKEIHDISKS